jgi:cation diffusion facilitator CzcD-associated flavoprotein CzcO
MTTDSHQPAASPEPPALPEHVRVAVVGAGFGGIGAAVTLGRAGHDVLVLEGGDRIGGTWRDNTYPGCACDVQSHLYSFSFAPNPSWSRAYSSQGEILAYLEDVVRRFDVAGRIRLRTEVASAEWDQRAALWRLRTSSGDLTANVLVAAAGPLSEPKLPDLPGLDSFGGTVLHSARWDPSVALAGRRVAVVGTGASAIQIVPRLAAVVAELTVFQRTPPWIMPRNDRDIPAAQRRLFARFPALQRLNRGWIYATREVGVVGLVHLPALMAGVERICRRHLRAQVADPGLRALLTPDYRAGCKRILLSDDYYPTLERENVELVPSGLAGFEPGVVIAADGTRREADAVVFATGFETTDLPIAHRVTGRDGRLLSEVWADSGMQALRGTTVQGFPNLFFLIGPNTGLGHTSMVHVIESQLQYLRDALDVMRDRGLAAVEPAGAAQQAWNRRVQERLGHTVWTTGGCASWYQDARGRITTLWPGSTLRLRRATRRIDLLEYRVTRRPDAAEPAPAATVGTGW